jgi:hypothetical protein
MVQGRAQVMDAIAEHDAPPKRGRFADLKSLDPFPAIRIEIAPREVGLRVLLREGPKLFPEDIELLFRPVELGDDAS